MRRFLVRAAGLALVALAGAGCRAPEPLPEPVGDILPVVDPDLPPPPEPPQLQTVQSVAVQGRTGPGGAPFEVERRTPSLSQYPCASCHEGHTVTGARDDDVHRNISAVHPRETGASCMTCHVPEAVDRLVLFTGERVDMDHAYRLCAQCHFGQTEAWAGGAHGKRVVGWAGRRVVVSCTDCHDPHAPSFERRIPFRAPNIPRTGGRDR